MTGDFHYPTPIRFGAGRIRELGQACAELGISRPLLVTDPGVAQLPIARRALDVLAGEGRPAAVFHDIAPNPVGADVDRGVDAFRAAGCDGVVAFGGGAALDVGKAIGLMVGQLRPLWDFEDRGDNHTRVDVSGMAPVVAVPTTSGTGSEVGRAAVITDADAGLKRIVFHPRMLPERVICDPELALGLPAAITAAVGMDALSHNLEAWCATGFHPFADGVALEGMRLVHASLERAVSDGGDLAARSQMMAASTLGATAFQKGLGAMHAMSHPIGAVYGAHHGLINAVVMPWVLRFNRPAIEDRLARAARALGLVDASYEGFVAWVLALRATLDIPPTLASLGVTLEEVPRLTRMALADPSGATNPVPLTEAPVAELFRDAVRGEP